MYSEGNVVEPYSRLGKRCVPFGILVTDQVREEERRSRYQVADKTKDIDGEVVDCQAVGRFALPVEEWLGIEGSGPTQRAVVLSVPSTVSLRETHYIHPTSLDSC